MANRRVTRGHLLGSTAILVMGGFAPRGLGRTYPGGSLPWEQNDSSPPIPVQLGPWVYFTADEATAVEAIVDRFAWRLNDAQAAAVVTYIRNAWGNTAAAVSPNQVR